MRLKAIHSLQFTITVVLLFFYCFCHAQIFLNGSFETTTGSACDYNLSNTTFDSKMSDCFAYGTGNEIDIMSSCLPYCPGAQSGTYYVAVANTTGSTPDGFTMKLSAPLVAGLSYTMSFWDHGDNSMTYQPTPVQIGVSATNNATGIIVYTGPTPSYGQWKQRTFTFIAPNNGLYISVCATTMRWTEVDNFEITIILPVQLLSFTGKAINNDVQLSWNTASEWNNAYFTIERSADGEFFDSILTEKGAGISTQLLNYNVYDYKPFYGKNFYRLCQTDIDGLKTYFRTIEMDIDSGLIERFSVFPNPTGGLLFLPPSEPFCSGDLTISTIHGQILKSLHETQGAVDLSSFPPGIYKISWKQKSQWISNYVVKQ
ncbi:MAG: carbohydrate binding domain-containing protein [Chitinophagales bacterium]